MDRVLHDIRNDLAIAIASVQAFIDGKLEPSAENLQEVMDVLEEVNRRLPELRGQRT
jgi:hypothetical protein